MKDPRAGKYRKLYSGEFQNVDKAVKGRGGILEWSLHDYQVFTYYEPGVSIVFYPHKGPSSGLRYLRFRNQGSTSAERFAEVAILIIKETGIQMKGVTN